MQPLFALFPGKGKEKNKTKPKIVLGSIFQSDCVGLLYG